VRDHSTFSRNRGRLPEYEVVAGFFAEVLARDDRQSLPSQEHFPVDGTLVQAGASRKSVRPKDGRTTRDRVAAA